MKDKIKNYEIERYEILYDSSKDVFNRQFSRIQKLKSQNNSLISLLIAFGAIFLTSTLFLLENSWTPDGIQFILVGVIIALFTSSLVKCLSILNPTEYKDLDLFSKGKFEKFLKVDREQLLSGLIFYVKESFEHNKDVYEKRMDAHIYCVKCFISLLFVLLITFIYTLIKLLM